MSDTPTVFEHGNGTDPAAPTRREQQGRPGTPTRREDGGAGGTRRETPTGQPRRGRRLRLPDSVAAQYEYLHDHHSGGEADTVLLRHKRSGDVVFFKYYRTEFRPDPMAMTHLLEAGRTDGYAHLVRIIDFHDGPDGTWEIQEYCRLGSLGDWVAAQGGRLDEETLMSVVREMAEALRFLHDLGSGIAHRDMKPQNVLVRSESPLDLVLADFGLAKAHQAFSHITTTAKGTWHYAAPEVHANVSTSKSDWFSLGAMIYEFYVGQKLFSMADGTEVSDDDARARSLHRNFTTELMGDPRWRLLADGLLTADKDLRWGADQVEAWMRGESPQVHASPVASDGRTPRPAGGYRPNWSPTLVYTPPELAEQLRKHWDDAATELAGRPDAYMIQFLQRFPDMEHAVRIIESTEAPGPKLVRLQPLLDPDGPIHYDGTPIDDQHLRQRIQAAAGGDDRALDWLDSMVKDRILSTFGEALNSDVVSHAAYLLARWRDQAESATRPLSKEYKTLARQAYRASLPMLFTRALTGEGDPA